jgi:predicted TPR repeat methyltransferase
MKVLQMETDQTTADQLERRAMALRRSWVRGLGRRCTSIEKAQIVHAARLSARAEMLARDPGTAVLGLSTLTREARTERAKVFAMLGIADGKREAEDVLTLPRVSSADLIAGMAK